MSILPAMQRAALRVAGEKPIVFFESSGQLEQEMCDLVNLVAEIMLRDYDWQALTKIASISGNGAIDRFPFPDDYARMPLVSDLVNSPNWFWGYYHPSTVNEFMLLRETGFLAWPGAWMIMDNAFQFAPAPTGETKFPYISKNYAIDGGTREPKSSFTTDADDTIFDHHVITAGLIWKWKEQKGLDYTGEQEAFEKAIEQASARDKGSRVIRKNSRYRRLNTYPAWPWELG